jgi:2-polyprenyl-3-methyl-5-hydroxy-6-metoxy-1,4-benzoquinol methylase
LGAGKTPPLDSIHRQEIMNNPYALNVSKYSTHGVILSALGINKTCLDVGCNDGYIGRLSHNSNQFYGLDHLKSSVESAKKVYKDAILYDLNALRPLPWNVKFDTIIFADVLEHVINARAVIGFMVKNYSQPNSKVIVSVPNIANWRIRLKLLVGQFNYTETGILDKTHVHFYTYKTARDLLESCGLKVHRTTAGSSVFGALISRLHFLRTLLATDVILIASYEA